MNQLEFAYMYRRELEYLNSIRGDWYPFSKHPMVQYLSTKARNYGLYAMTTGRADIVWLLINKLKKLV